MSILENKEIVISLVNFTKDKMFIELSSFIILSVPFTYTQKLKNAKVEDLKDYRLIVNGHGIHFNNIDEDLSL